MLIHAPSEGSESASEADFRKLAESMPQIVWIAREDGWITYCNQQWLDYTGLTLRDSLGHGWNRQFHPDDRDRAIDAWKHAADTLGPYSIHGRVRRADGVYRWWLIRGVPVKDAGEQVVEWFGTCTDIHDLKVAELELAQVNIGLRESKVRITRQNRVYAVLSQIDALIVRKPGRDELFREVCRVAVELGVYRYAWVGLLDRDADLLTPAAYAGDVPDFFDVAPREVFECQPGGIGLAGMAIRERKPQVRNEFSDGRHKLAKKEMEERGIHSFAHIPLVVEGEAIGVIALYAQDAGFFDAEEMHLLQNLAGNLSVAIENIEKRERLDYLAYYDPLTGLANRTLFLDRVAQHMRGAAAGGHQLAMFLIDLNRFKNINDSFGRVAGDQLLKQVAVWLTEQLGDVNLLSRIGADQFGLVVPAAGGSGDVAHVIEPMMAAFSRASFEVAGETLRIAARAGIAMYPSDGNEAEALFKCAEAALKRARGEGARYLFHAQQMTESVASQLAIENQLRQALENNEFVLHYQPKVSLGSGYLVGAEALIRWNHPQAGLMPPGLFIPILEETGMIDEVGRWALRQAVSDWQRWRQSGLPAVRIAVNVSPLQLRDPSFVAQLGHAIAVSDEAAQGLELEITESMIMDDVEQRIATLKLIRGMGISVAVDDFGTGFSSLGYLAKLPIDTLKIDRMFIHGMVGSAEGLSLVSTMLTLARSLKLKAIAEGVETREQARLLRELSCDEMQGYLISQPIECEAFEARFLTGKWRFD